jgi:hypothetical protein
MVCVNGSLKAEVYPWGRWVDYDVDNAGRTNKVPSQTTIHADMMESAGVTNPFMADGRIAQMKLGNNLWETRDYRTPGAPTVYMLGTASNSGNLLQLEYAFDSTQNNGNLASRKIIRGGNSWRKTILTMYKMLRL